MSRGLGSTFKTALSSGYIRPCYLLDLELNTGSYLRYTTWSTDIVYNSNTYIANAFFKKFDTISEGLDGTEQLSIELTGEPSALISTLYSNIGRRREGIVYFALLDDDCAVIDTPIRFVGAVESASLKDGVKESTIKIDFSSLLSRLDTPKGERFNHESQQILYSGDKGFEYVEKMKDLYSIWGRVKIKIDRYGNAQVKEPKKQNKKEKKKKK